MLIVETSLAKQEVNRGFATQATSTQAALISVLSKDGQKAFTQLIKRLNDG